MTSIGERQAASRAINDMLKAGFGYETVPMRSLLQHAMKGDIAKFKTADAPKKCLKIYYMVDPRWAPTLTPSERINTLVNLVCLLNIKTEDSSVHMKACEPLPGEVRKVLPTNFLPAPG